MSLLSSIGRSISSRKGAMGMGALTVGASVQGFSQGIGNQDLSSRMYEAATGDPDIDKYVFGTDVGIRQLMAPMPWDRTAMNIKMFNKQNIARTFAAKRAGMFPGEHGENTGLYDNSMKRTDGGYMNQMPIVNGSLVLGAYNARMG